MDKDMSVVKEKIVNWIKQKVQEAGAEGAIVGMSGGIDSSVVAVLAKEALGDNFFGVMMPCKSIDEDADHAFAVAEKFGITREFVDVEPIFNRLIQSLPKTEGIAVANVKPRLRMTILYYFANMHNYLVLGTDNKTESLIGYFTKYGDGGVDLLPISGLYKTGVKELARFLGIPKEIIEKPPSAGLWPGQTDEGEIGMTYDELDRILMAIESGNTVGIDPDKLDKIQKMVKKSEHKRILPKACEL